MRVEVWSDVVCPWCYIGKRRLESAIDSFEGDVQVEWRSFELDPNAPKALPISLTQALASKYGMSTEKAAKMQEDVTKTALEDGIEMRFDLAKTGNTFDAHRLIHYAASLGLGPQMKERLLKAYFTDGHAIGDTAELTALAGEMDLDTTLVAEVLASDAFADAVRADEQQAQAYGARGVPFFVIDGRYGISGAQPAETLLKALQQAYAEITPTADAAPTCDDDGCAI